MELQNKVALITGGGEGLGKAAALLLSKEGAKIGVLGHTEQNVCHTVSEIEEQGGRAMKLIADVSDAAAMQKACKDLASRFGGIDVVFANAGINGVWAPIEEFAPEEFEKTIASNLTGTFFTIKYAFPFLKKKGGAVVVTSSINGTRTFSNTGATAYSASKAGQVAMAKMLALEFAKHKVRVNVICPGAIETLIDENTEKRDVDTEKEPVEFPSGSIPLTDGKPGSAGQVAELVLFLVSNRSSHITGSEIWIDGAQSLLVG